MTRKVINPPRADTHNHSKTCPTCGRLPVLSHPQTSAHFATDFFPASVGIPQPATGDPFDFEPLEYLPPYPPLREHPQYQEPAMGLSYNVYLNSDKIFGCKNCKTHLASHDSIISRNFRGQHGKAFLFNNVVNTTQSEAVERNMTTGRHQVRDVNCKQCKETVGWKYDKAYEASEKYKEGKFILEAELLCQVY
ncbi:MAG: hypothetical protein L6R39_003114 [Caloplaca ligustica]|nr:MAG: hypothetical protein L6R39_003114 [Caloplaca ligustica]